MADAVAPTQGSAQLEYEHAAAFRTELRRFLARTEKATKDAGLTPQRYDLLLAIKAGGDELTINELCTRLGMRQTAVTELVKRAEESGLVNRTGSTVDRRVVLVTMTPDAERRLSLAFETLRADRSSFGEALDLLRSTLEAPPPAELHPILDPTVLTDGPPPS